MRNEGRRGTEEHLICEEIVPECGEHQHPSNYNTSLKSLSLRNSDL